MLSYVQTRCANAIALPREFRLLEMTMAVRDGSFENCVVQMQSNTCLFD
jgi:hypothetical protein